MRRLLIPLLAVLFGFVAPPARAQEADSTVAPKSALHGAYSTPQAERGKRTFELECGSCHTPHQFGDGSLLRTWKGRTVHDLLESIRTTMPFDAPGRLSRQQYADVLAYFFRLSGIPPGERALPGDTTLKRIRIEPR